MLARMGCVVFHYDMVGYADCVQVPQHKEGFTDAESVLRLQSVLGLQLWDSIRALDFVESLPDVDPKRIAVTGASGGATQTLLLAVVDDRPAAVFPAVMIGEDMQGGCVCENAPLLRIGTNNDLALKHAATVAVENAFEKLAAFAAGNGVIDDKRRIDVLVAPRHVRARQIELAAFSLIKDVDFVARQSQA